MADETNTVQPADPLDARLEALATMLAGEYPPYVLGDLRLAAGLLRKASGVLSALGALHHAVCGETGFASAVRHDSGFAYPWPALDEADELARAALTQAGTL